MIGKDAAEHRWSIGELAGATGVTVRTLHHYDEIGLLRASGRTASGHRRYTEEDLRRLYRVRALSALGIPLERIRSVLDSSSEDLAGMRGLLTAQLDRLNARADQIQRLAQQVSGLLQRLETGSMPDPHQFMTTLETISMLDRYFTEEQREQMAQGIAAAGPEAAETTKLRWAELVERLLDHVRTGTPVDDPRVRGLLGEYDRLGAPFQPEGVTNEQRERLRAAVQRMWRDHGGDIVRNLPWSAEEMAALHAYLDRARATRDAPST
ncbi:MerR family transcriptional regulator [Streptosporangium saharense]|uniref:MerR family transcriptional regulator n=1 Tax=Streptosporangium saharense TaxID=1706840 RepID=UPI00342456B2